MRYLYTNKAYIKSGSPHGTQCDPIKRNNKCIVGRGNQLVQFANGTRAVVVRRTLRLSDKYPANWSTIANTIKKQARWHCEHCRHPHDPPTGHTLTVHHVNGIKADCTYNNLVALCQRCHLRIQAAFLPNQTVMPFAKELWMSKRGLG